MRFPADRRSTLQRVDRGLLRKVRSAYRGPDRRDTSNLVSEISPQKGGEAPILRGWLLSAALFAVLLVVLSAASRTESVSDPSSVWNRVPDREVVFGGEGNQEMESVTIGGPGLVAVGLDSSGGDWDAAVWTSVDGVSWSRVAHDEAVFGGVGDQAMESVTVGGPGLVAVGLDFSGGDEDAAVWTSVDGLSWSRVAHDELVFGGVGDQEMESVTAGGPGLVAVGLDAPGGDVDAAVWTSVDGLSWMRVAHDEAIFGGSATQEMESVTAGGPGLVAVGLDAFGGYVDAAVWTSVDGLSWMRVAHDEAIFGGNGAQEMESVTAGGPGLVAVGVDYAGGDSDVAAWVWVFTTEEASD